MFTLSALLIWTTEVGITHTLNYIGSGDTPVSRRAGWVKVLLSSCSWAASNSWGCPHWPSSSLNLLFGYSIYTICLSLHKPVKLSFSGGIPTCTCQGNLFSSIFYRIEKVLVFCSWHVGDQSLWYWSIYYIFLLTPLTISCLEECETLGPTGDVTVSFLSLGSWGGILLLHNFSTWGSLGSGCVTQRESKKFLFSDLLHPAFSL